MPKGESGTLAGDEGADPPASLPADGTDRAGGRRMVMLRVTAGASAGGAAAAVEDGEKEAYLRSLPRPDSGRGPATVSSHSWSRSPMQTCARFNVRTCASMIRSDLSSSVSSSFREFLTGRRRERGGGERLPWY